MAGVGPGWVMTPANFLTPAKIFYPDPDRGLTPAKIFDLDPGRGLNLANILDPDPPGFDPG